MNIIDSVKKINELIKPTLYQGDSDLERLFNQIHRKNLVNDLYNDDKDILSTLSKLKFNSELDLFMNELRKQDKSCDIIQYKAFIKHLKEIPFNNYDVYAELFGVKLMRGIIQLGDFTIYDQHQSYDDIVKKYPRIGYDVLDKLRTMHITLVCITITARDFAKAREIAADYFQQFEYTFLYYTSPHSGSSTYVRILQGKWHSKVKMLCVTDNSIYEYQSTPDDFSVYKFDSFVEDFKKALNPILWKLITKNRNDMNPIEKRLSIAIEWYGKAMVEENTNQTLLQYCIAVETLVSISKGNQTQQFKENTAFIVGDTRARRMDIVRKMGILYDKRSKLVHGADDSSSVSFSDVEMIKNITYKLIERFINFEPLCNFKTNKELIEWIDIQKYSVATEQ